MKRLIVLTIKYFKNIIETIRKHFMKLNVGNFFHYETEKTKVKNVVDPIIKILTIFILPISIILILIGIIKNKDLFIYFGFFLTGGGFFTFICAYIYFSLRDPNKLQSEIHQREIRKIEIDYELRKNGVLTDVSEHENIEGNQYSLMESIGSNSPDETEDQ